MMSDEEPTVAVPVALIEDALSIIDMLDADQVSNELRSLLPKPTPRRLRVVDLDAGLVDEYMDGSSPGRSVTFDCDPLEAAPDVMAIVEQQVSKWHSPGDQYLVAPLVENIRAAIEEAVGRG
jgi:hypothetical protein